MISQNKRTIQSPNSGGSSTNCTVPNKQGLCFATPISGNTQKKKAKKECKKIGSHQRKVSENRVFYHQNNIVISNGNINGVAFTNGNVIIQDNNNNNISPNNFIDNNDIMAFNSNANINNNFNYDYNNINEVQPNYNYQSNEPYHSNNSTQSHKNEEETSSSGSNQDIKNKLLNLLTQKNDCKKLIASKSSGNSLDFAIGEFGRRKKSPQNQINNNYIIGGVSNHQYHLGKKSPPSKMRNLLYFQEKTANKSQIQNNSSTQLVLSPKETKNVHNVFLQTKPQKKDQHMQVNQQHKTQQPSFSPILSTVMKSKGLSPENKDSVSPSKQNLKNIIASQKHIGISPNKFSGSGENNSSGNLVQVDSKAALKKKLSVPKLLNQDINSFLSKRNNSKERIINLFNTKQEALTDHNTRKNSTLSKQHKSVSPENQQQMQKNIKKAISSSNQQQLSSQKSNPFFKKYRPPELEEIASSNTISQSVPNSSKHNIQNTFNTPNNQNLNNPHGTTTTQHNQTKKKYYFDNNLTSSNSQLINSHTINANRNNPVQNLNLSNINKNLINNPTTLNSNPNICNPNPNNISNSINYSHSARSNIQVQNMPHSNQFYQNYINPYINNNTNQSKIITAAITYNLKNAENRLMKIQEDILEGGEQNESVNEQLQKTFLRTSKLLSGYKARELKWEQEKRVLVDEIKFLKNLLYTEQFDDLVINSQMNWFITNFACFTLVICALCA